jgi:hypothetical protein
LQATVGIASAQTARLAMTLGVKFDIVELKTHLVSPNFV